MSKTNELAAAADCGMQAVRALQRACTAPAPVSPAWDNDLLHVERMTRLAAYHAFKARPDLRPPDNYDIAIAEAKAARRRA